MTETLWARVEERKRGKALVLYRNELVSGPRGPMVEARTVFVVEKIGKSFEAFDGEAASLELTSTEVGGDITVSATIKHSAQDPRDPEIPRIGFEDKVPEHEEKKKKIRKRGMGKFLGKDDKKAATQKPGSPPVPPEQRRRGASGLRAPTRRRRPKR